MDVPANLKEYHFKFDSLNHGSKSLALQFQHLVGYSWEFRLWTSTPADDPSRHKTESHVIVQQSIFQCLGNPQVTRTAQLFNLNVSATTKLLTQCMRTEMETAMKRYGPARALSERKWSAMQKLIHVCKRP